MLESLMKGDIDQAILWLLAVAIAITIHEFAHAVSALAAGDDTAKRAGRVTLNPLAHYDPVGSTFFLLFGFGWAKPVPVNPRNFRNPRWHDALVSFWGPLSNMLLAAILLLLARFQLIPSAERLMALVLLCIQLNLVLAFFNLIPLPPLDGSHIMKAILPHPQSQMYVRFVGQWGMFLLLAIILLPRIDPRLDLLGWYLNPAISFFFRIFLGPL
ncbi:MAG: site-2 protease family protein [Armatimonadetes bacterium]|nr:site-2 protease family protein [Armatimonadota bacterium]